jgi:hypothetical protein
MPVFRYKSFEQAQQALWQYGTGREYYRQVSNLFDFYDKLRARTPSGIFKFESLEAFDKQKMAWIVDFAINRHSINRGQPLIS